LVGAVITIYSVRHAPEGFEDGDGFHYVHPTEVPSPGHVRGHADVPPAAGIRLA
jgi:hypothetical protein